MRKPVYGWTGLFARLGLTVRRIRRPKGLKPRRLGAEPLEPLGRRAVGVRYGIGAAAVGAIHQRLAARPEVLRIVESLAEQLCKTRTKLKV